MLKLIRFVSASYGFFAVHCDNAKMKRYLEELINRTPKGKMILLAGPRQVGKNYLSLQALFRL